MLKTLAIVMLVVLGALAGSVFAAGGGLPPTLTGNPSSLSDGFVIPGILNAQWKISDDQNGQAGASISMNLEDGQQLERAGWNFSSSYFNPVQWWAHFKATGYVLEPGEQTNPFTLGQNSRFGRDDIQFYLGTNADRGVWLGEDGEILGTYQSIYGTFGILPAQIHYSTFAYDEYQETWGEERTRWSADFTITGDFLSIG